MSEYTNKLSQKFAEHVGNQLEVHLKIVMGDTAAHKIGFIISYEQDKGEYHHDENKVNLFHAVHDHELILNNNIFDRILLHLPSAILIYF